MLVNVSYKNKEQEELVDNTLGKGYNIVSRIRSGAFGSPKLFITGCSSEIHELLMVDFRTKTANIEIRPNGIIVGFQSRLDAYGLVIPFYRMDIYRNGEEFSIYHQHHVITFSGKEKPVQRFFKHLLDLKTSYLEANPSLPE